MKQTGILRIAFVPDFPRDDWFEIERIPIVEREESDHIPTRLHRYRRLQLLGHSVASYFAASAPQRYGCTTVSNGASVTLSAFVTDGRSLRAFFP
jgi:hypothetical protein